MQGATQDCTYLTLKQKDASKEGVQGQVQAVCNQFLELVRSSGLVLTSAAVFTGGSEWQGCPDPC